MVTINRPLCEVKLLKDSRDKLVVRSPEKAGVGVQLRPWPPYSKGLWNSIPPKFTDSLPTVTAPTHSLRPAPATNARMFPGPPAFRCDGLSVDIQGGANVAVAQKFLRQLWVIVVSNQMRSRVLRKV
jgi:hypothetical protein